jgi:putative ABC transport system substrate-binding protein
MRPVDSNIVQAGDQCDDFVQHRRGDRMRRRDCLALAAALAALRPTSPLVQELNSPVLGFLNSASPEAFQPYLAAFHEGLSEFGLHEGQNLRIEWRWARGAYERLPALAAELVQMKVQVLVATGGEVSALAARRATATIPIVFGVGGDALEEGLVTSLGRPGTNLTGITHLTSELEAKRMELLWEALPPDSPLGVIINPAQTIARRQRQAVEEAGRSVGRAVFIVEASAEEEFESVFDRLVRAGAADVVVGSDPFFNRAAILGTRRSPYR